MHLTNSTIEKYQEYQYKKDWLFVLVDKATPLRNFTLYDSLTNWCGCG